MDGSYSIETAHGRDRRELLSLILGSPDEDGLWDYEFVGSEMKYFTMTDDAWIIHNRKI